MPIASRPYRRALLLAVLALAVAPLLAWFGSRGAPARAATVGQLQRQIKAGEGAVSGLAGQVSAATSHLGQLQTSISGLEHRISAIQQDLDAKRAELIRLASQLHTARVRLIQLQAQEQHDETVLSAQLVSTYEGNNPDLVTVVLESTGFQDLLERLSFQSRIRKQDVSVVAMVKAARRAEIAQATRLGALELRQQRLTRQVAQQRDQLVGTQLTLVHQEIAVAHDRDAKAGRLADARGHLSDLRAQLGHLQAVQAAQAAAARDAARQSAPAARTGSSAPAAAPVSAAPVASAGGFVFPLPRSAAASPGAWSPDQGVDISAPGNTPEYAVCSGTVVLHGIGGFGPWAPVLHCDSPLDGYSYVYYGHAGPADQLAVGTHVSAGQVMSSIGPGIVGISTGPHLEIGFCDSSGTPIGSGSASTMLALLHSAY